MRAWILLLLAGCGSDGVPAEPPATPAPGPEPAVIVAEAEPAAEPLPAPPAVAPPGLAEPPPSAPPPVAPPPKPGARAPSPASASPAAGSPARTVAAPVEAPAEAPATAEASTSTTITAPAAPAAPEPVTYRLGRRSYAAVLIRYDRKATIPGHDHVLVSRDVRGQVTWTEGDPAACRVNVEIPAASLVVDPPGSRRRAGLDGETSEGDRQAILENALGKRQLDAARFPTLSFVSSGCAADGDRVRVAGTLTVHGVGKAVSPSMTVVVKDGVLTARGRLQATHADFGMEPFTAVLGALRNDPRLDFDLEFVGE